MSYEEIAEPSSLPLGQRTLGQIAASLPGASAVFRRHHLDFCCGGNVILAAAAARKGIPVALIRAELEALDADASSVAPQEPADLVDHILMRYHEVHRRELPELIRLAHRVEAVHAAHEEVPAGLADALEDLRLELEDHMEKEEAILFPMMKAGGTRMLAMRVTRMRVEHDEHGARLRIIEEISRGCIAPEDACPTWDALYVGVRKLIDDLMEHIHLENNVLFPRFVPAPGEELE